MEGILILQASHCAEMPITIIPASPMSRCSVTLVFLFPPVPRVFFCVCYLSERLASQGDLITITILIHFIHSSSNNYAPGCYNSSLDTPSRSL